MLATSLRWNKYQGRRYHGLNVNFTSIYADYFYTPSVTCDSFFATTTLMVIGVTAWIITYCIMIFQRCILVHILYSQSTVVDRWVMLFWDRHYSLILVYVIFEFTLSADYAIAEIVYMWLLFNRSEAAFFPLSSPRGKYLSAAHPTTTTTTTLFFHRFTYIKWSEIHRKCNKRNDSDTRVPNMTLISLYFD